MKTASPALVAFLNTATECVKPNLYTFTLAGGTVLRYTDADVPISFGGVTWFRGPKIDRSGVSAKRGVEVSTLKMTLYPDLEDLIGGVPLIKFIRAGGFDGAQILLERAFGPTWDAIVGKLVSFSGRVATIPDISGTEVSIEAASWLELLNQNMPRNLIQPPCLHTLFDSGCGLSKAAFAAAGAVTTSGSSDLTFATNVGNPTGYFDQGTIQFTGGPNAGQIRTIRSQVGGSITVVLGLLEPPNSGDTFVAYPGCDRTRATCSAKFSNLLRHRGFKDVPIPETIV